MRVRGRDFGTPPGGHKDFLTKKDSSLFPGRFHILVISLVLGGVLDSPLSRLKNPLIHPRSFPGTVFCLAGRMGESGLTGRDMGESGFPDYPGFAKNQAWSCGDLEFPRQIAILGLFWAICSWIHAVISFGREQTAIQTSRHGPSFITVPNAPYFALTMEKDRSQAAVGLCGGSYLYVERGNLRYSFRKNSDFLP